MATIAFPDPYPRTLRYAMSVVTAVVGTLLSWLAISRGVRLDSAFMLTAVTISAWFGGMAPGLFCAALCFGGQLLLRDPIGYLRIQSREEWISIGVFALNAVVISALFRQRYAWRTWNHIFPATVTGGWWWKYDNAGEGTVDLSSPAFPHLSVTRSYSSWLEQVHPDDRERVQEAVRNALRMGRLEVEFHTVLPDGEVRRISMCGMAFDHAVHQLTAICLEIGSAKPDPQGFLR